MTALTALTTTGPVLVLLDRHALAGPVLHEAAAELVALARGIAATWGGGVEVVWSGPAAQEAAAVLGSEGVTAVHHLVDEPATSAHAAASVAGVIARTASGVVLAPASFALSEVAAGIGVLTGAGVVVDASGLEIADGRLVVTRTVFAGTWTTRCAVSAPLAVVTVKPHAVGPAAAAPVAAPATVLAAEVVTPGFPVATVVERTERAVADRPDLTSAQVVVVGGRGTNGDFSALEDLADVLGGAVGATRVATDEGWIGHESQIGQTGVTITPRLYIGAGVSGAVHHRGGMQASGTIVAVNSDPDSPIFEIADLGIVGDLFSVLPQATAELRRLKA